MEASIIPREGLPLVTIPAAGLHGVGWLQALRGIVAHLRGFSLCRQLMRRDRPTAIFTTGGYLGVPVTLAARLSGVPVLLYVPDVEPAESVKFIARYAQQIAVTVEDSRAFLPAKKVVVTGYPLRKSLMRWTRAEGRAALGLEAQTPVLLIYGGSRGARSLNRAVLRHLPALLDLAQVLHLTGELDWPEVATAREALPPEARARYHAYPYLHEEMGAALAAADLAVARAGASILGEMPYFGLPALLVPYPYAWRYQKVNAQWLEARGAARMLRDEGLADELLPQVEALLRDEERRLAMAQAARALAQPQAADHLARALVALGR